MYRELLSETDVMVDMWASCNFCNFCNFKVRSRNNLVPDTTNASLVAFYPSELFDKRFAIGTTISGLGRTVFKFALDKVGKSIPKSNIARLTGSVLYESEVPYRRIVDT
jgi:hypothetical protein